MLLFGVRRPGGALADAPLAKALGPKGGPKRRQGRRTPKSWLIVWLILAYALVAGCP
jgi:hypothetical protein